MDADGRLYVRTESDAGKVKRVRANGRVLVGPANVRGRPLGPMAEGTARVLDAAEHPAAERAVQSNYGVGRRLYEAVLGSRGDANAYLEVTST
jgi:PPOX class probable F420-dependent enzyme